MVSLATDRNVKFWLLDVDGSAKTVRGWCELLIRKYKISSSDGQQWHCSVETRIEGDFGWLYLASGDLLTCMKAAENDASDEILKIAQGY